jgi:TDG/mug DNA glycosylase family protein
MADKSPRLLRPTPAEFQAARERRLRDVISRGLKVLFCGINPGLYSAAVGHHFARPGNRFWPALHAGGFTAKILSPYDDASLLERGYGITNIVARATASADELTREELLAGADKLRRKVRRYRPGVLAILGVGAYRTAFGQKAAAMGLQPQMINSTRLWILPNPSGLNAHFQPKDLARLFKELHDAFG